jgi:probable F420-dependent oxidoreductase
MSDAAFRFLAPMPRLRNAASWAASLRRIEDLGFHAATISEHYCGGWAMDALTAMNFALAATTRLRALPLVLNNDMHHPAILAKAIATADVLSGGRVAIGLGAGWLEADYTALGTKFDPGPIRVGRLEEALQIITAFFAARRVTFDGCYYRLNDMEASPTPVQHFGPPVLVGGGGPRMLALAGRYADIVGLHLQAGPRGTYTGKEAERQSRREVERKIGLVAAAAASAGRPAPELQVTCYDVNIGGAQITSVPPSFAEYFARHSAIVGDTPMSLRGDVSKCVDDLWRWHEELGISYWSLGSNVEAIAPIVARLSGE